MRAWATALLALPILVNCPAVIAAEPHPAGRPDLADARAAYRSLPLSFEPNRGQSDPRVKFMARSQGLTLFLTSTDAVLVTREAALKMRVLGANPDAVAEGLDELPGRIHSLIGRDPRKWRTDGRAYARVLYREIYPGIDLAYYGTRRQGLEYDFVVAAGASPRAIRLGFEGADRIELSAEGGLLLHVGPASLRFGKPVVYQHVGGARREIQGGWVRDGAATVGFQVAAYDPSAALVIDPIVSLATYLGGSAADQAFAVAVDPGGSVYVTGNTTSPDFPTTAGSFAPAVLGAIDAFVVKLSHDLSTTIYSTYLGGTTGADAGRNIAVDTAGNAYVTGFTNSTDFPTTTGAFQTALGGGSCSGVPCNDAFVVKLDPTGATLVYGTYLGGNDSDVGLGIAVDATGNAHVTGGTFSTNFPTTAGAVQPAATAGGSREAFVTKLNPLGTALVYSTFLGGTGDDVGNAVALSGSGGAYVTGSTASANFPLTIGSFQTVFGGPAGGTDAFVTALSAGGALVYSTLLGGIASDEGLSITVDTGGNAYVTGATSSLNFPATGAFTFSGTTTEAFLTELNLAGSALVVSRAVPTGRLDTAARDPASPSISVGIARDGVGNIFISGSEIRCVGVGCVPNTDAFVVSLDPTATSTTSQFVGGAGDDFGLGMAVDASGNVLLVGDTTSADFPVTASAVQKTFGGGTDAFVVMITQLGMNAAAGGGNSSTCFVATAAFGSPMAREVGVLRELRDDVLLPHAAGRAAVAAYYRIGPAFAGVIARSETLRALVRASLAPMIWLAPLARGHAVLAFYLVIGTGSLVAALLVVAVAARRARLGRRPALAATFVIALVIGSGVALLDLTDHQRPKFASVQRHPSPAVSAPAVDPGSAPTRPASTAGSEDARSVSGIRAIGADRYQVELGASGRSVPDLARLVTVRPTLAGFQIMSDIGDGILTADGLLVTNPKLATSAGIEAGDRILAINGHPPAGGFFLAVVKLRRDPDSGPVRVEVERAGTRIEKTVVMR
jgi:beta-propeller repeat-containing protein